MEQHEFREELLVIGRSLAKAPDRDFFTFTLDTKGNVYIVHHWHPGGFGIPQASCVYSGTDCIEGLEATRHRARFVLGQETLRPV